ncbi:hypothetical protein QE152_g41146 [Popillia japonica]|uniref:Uncharacterized protein n=1 Tax=Popillia japonica TaxID=7064 RepID=A0AAW1H3T0_POPJA
MENTSSTACTVKLNTTSSTACTPPVIDLKKIPEPSSVSINGRNAENKTKSRPSEEKIARSQSVPSTVTMQCELKIPDKTNSKQVDNKNKILILSDSQGRNSAALLNKLLDYNYSVQSICKPNAMFDDVVRCDNSLFDFNKTIFNNLKLFNAEGRYFVETNEIIDIYSDKYNRAFHLNVKCFWKRQVILLYCEINS